MTEESLHSPHASDPAVGKTKSTSERLKENDAVILRNQERLKRARREKRRLEKLQVVESRRKERQDVEDYKASLPANAKFTVSVLLTIGAKAEESGRSVADVFDWLDGKRPSSAKNKQSEHTSKSAEGPTGGTPAGGSAGRGGGSPN